ncbi:hypothetical protein D3C71_1717520 [compost metagenome]
MPVIAGHVVHQHRKVAAQLGRRFGHAGLQGVHVAHITHTPPGAGQARVGNVLGEGFARVAGHIHKGYAGALFGKRRHDGCANAAAATRHKHGTALQTGELRQAPGGAGGVGRGRGGGKNL